MRVHVLLCDKLSGFVFWILPFPLNSTNICCYYVQKAQVHLLQAVMNGGLHLKLLQMVMRTRSGLGPMATVGDTVIHLRTATIGQAHSQAAAHQLDCHQHHHHSQLHNTDIRYDINPSNIIHALLARVVGVVSSPIRCHIFEYF